MSAGLLGRRSFGTAALALLGVSAFGCHAHDGPPTRTATGGSGRSVFENDREWLETPEGQVSIDALDPQIGPRQARCVIVVFSDFQCPFCHDAALVVGRLRKEHEGSVRVVFKHLPAQMHRYAQAASIAAQIVFLEAGSSAFWRFHDRLFEHQNEIDDRRLTEWSAIEGVGADAIVRRAPEAERRVRDDGEEAGRLGIHGTPHLYVNDRVVEGFYPYETMKPLVEGML
jgi:protein-disulfide isomerase